MKLIRNSFKFVNLGFFLSISAVAALFFISGILNGKSGSKVLGLTSGSQCKTLKDNLKLDGRLVVGGGFDSFGYNFDERMFKGSYCNAFENAQWCQPYKDVDLLVSWNNTFLSDTDCNSDGSLDRHHRSANYVGSDALLTNQMWGSYTGNDGKIHTWTYFLKISSAPSEAEPMGGFWYDDAGNELGEQVWDQFVIVEEIFNDPYGGSSIQNLAPVAPGFTENL